MIEHFRDPRNPEQTYTVLTGDDADKVIERDKRIARLIRDRGMSQQAARVVVDAAMFGKGCVPKEYAGKHAAQITSGHGAVDRV